MSFKRIGDDVYYEVFPLKSGKKIIIYLKNVRGKYVENPKCFGTHVLEQIFDENNNVVSEVIKENSHKIEVPCSLFKKGYR